MTRWTRGRVALAALLVVFLSGLALAQELTTGIIEGVVKDDKGNPIAQATVSVEGKQGTRTATTDTEGRFNVRSLPAGNYTVKAEAQGFGTVVQSDVVVNVNKRTQVPFKLSTGRVETVTVTSEAPIVDMKNTTVGATVSVSNMVDYLPLGRNFTAMFTLSPGVVSGLQAGAGNYSISGSSGLENSYLVDGVNITNSGYGGIGSYNRVYGSLGSGVTNDFIDQVEVKEAGFEAEFGQATGGVVNAVVKSGGNKLSGQVSIYGQPTSFESERKLTALFPDDDPIKSRQQYDVGLSLGGPFIKDKLFWYAAYNPVQTKTVIERTALDPTIPSGRTAERTRDNNNYAAKFSWYATPNHRIEATAFGDPSKGKYGAQRDAAVRRDGEDGFSTIDYGGNNASVKYAGALTSNFFVDALVARHKSKLIEDAKDLYLITNFNVTGGLDYGGLGFAPDTDESVDQYALKLTYVIGNHEIKGGWQRDKVSYSESGAQTGPNFTEKLPIGVLDVPSDTYLWNGEYLDVPSTTGAYLYQQKIDPTDPNSPDFFKVQRSRTSPLAVLTHNTEDNFFLQDTWSITPRWTLRAGVRYTKEYVAGGAPFVLPFAFVADDTLVDPTGTTVYDPQAITFPKEWAPRVGVTWDVQGDGRHKLYANYSKMVQRLTQDLAYRAFSNEIDLSQNWLDAALTVPQEDSTCPLLGGGNAPCQSYSIVGSSPTSVWKDTKLPYTQEYLLGYTRELNENMSVDLRYIHRQIGRVIEDFSYVPQEMIANRYWGPFRWVPETDTSPIPTFNPFPAYSVGAFGNYVLGNPSVNSGSAIAELGGGGYPDFPKPRRDYDAFEVIFNKRFSDNWVGWVSYRYGQLIGNYEGLIRNDTGQDDPNITSLYDFPDTPLMHGQFIAGPLNADVKHNLKAFATYQFKNGLSVGAALNWASGVPRFPSLVHPNDFYQLPASGEVPGTNPVYASWYETFDIATGTPQGDPFLVLSHGIGAAPTEYSTGAIANGQLVFSPYTAPDPLVTGTVDRPLINARFGTSQFLYSYTTVKRDFGGRTPDLTTIDVHLSYNIKTGWKNSNLNLGFDMFNVFNTQEGDTWDDVLELNQAQANPNYGRPLTFGSPRTARVSLKWSF